MNAYSLIFYAPAVQTAAAAMSVTELAETTSLTNDSRSPSAIALQLCSVMSNLLYLQPISENPLYAVTPHALLYNFMPSDTGKQKRLLRYLWLAVALVPWRHLTYDVKKRKVPVLENVIREGLKVSLRHLLILFYFAMNSKPSVD